MFPSLRSPRNIMSNNAGVRNNVSSFSSTLGLKISGQIVYSPGQTIATCQRNISQQCWAQHVACVWPPCCDVLVVVGSNLTMVKFEPSNLSQQHPTCRNTSQQGGQTHATCCAQQCCDMLRWHVAIVWPKLKTTTTTNNNNNNNLYLHYSGRREERRKKSKYRKQNSRRFIVIYTS